MGELQHYYVSSGSYLWMQGLYNCVDYAFSLFVGIIEEGGEVMAVVVSSGGAPTPAGTSVFTKHNWDMGMGYLWLNGWGIYHLMGGAFMAYWVGHL